MNMPESSVIMELLVQTDPLGTVELSGEGLRDEDGLHIRFYDLDGSNTKEET